jgi:uncharacterized repeat protein (TIGR03803 family)
VKPKRKGNLIKLPLKSVIALLIMASASLVGAQTLQTLCSFSVTNGAYTRSALTQGNDGNFYGTTLQGGIGDNGTVFQVTTNGTLTTLVSFNVANGSHPQAGLTLERTSPERKLGSSNWTTGATLLLNASPYLWIDQNPVSGNKFYRAMSLP